MDSSDGLFVTHWRRWLLMIWLIGCAVLLYYRWKAILAFGLPDTDDNMRISQVRALLNGQDWYDLRQYKLNPPEGYNIHWTRLVDLPIAAIILTLKPFFGGIAAEKAAVAIAPLIPLGVALFAMGVAVRRLVHPGAFAIAAILMLVSCQAAMLMFMPLRIDHHGWQLAMLVITFAGLADAKPWRGGLTMGLSSAVSLAIGLELMPFLVISGAAVVLHWVWDRNEALRLRGYGLALAIGCAGGYLVFASYDNAVARCDTLSLIWTPVMIAAGGLALALSFVRDGRWPVRLVLAAVGGAALGGAFAYLYPQCIGRPEEISPELVKVWFSNVREAKPLYTQQWQTAVGVVILPVIGVIGSFWAAWRAWGTRSFGAWAPVALVAIVSLLLVLWQTRQGPAAQLMAVPGATALIVAVVPPLLASRFMLVRTLGTVAAILLLSGTGVVAAITQFPTGKGKSSAYDKAVGRANALCPTLWAMKPIARLPATTIFTFVDLGPRLITVTHHKAVAGPYHRNGTAILDVHHAFGGSPDEARAIIKRHGATMLLICPNMSEATVHKARHPNGFYAQLARGDRFDWLTPVDLPKDSPFKLWHVHDPAPPQP